MHMKKIQALALAAAIAVCPIALSSCAGVRTSPAPTRQGTTQIGQNMGFRGLNQGTGTGIGMNRTGTGMGMNGTGTGLGMGSGTAGTGTGSTAGNGIIGGTGTRMGTAGTAMTADAQRGAKIQSELKRQIPQLKDVNALVVGNTALVGYKTTGKTAGTSTLKDSITRVVKKVDPSVTTVQATQSGAMVARIKKLASDVANSRPITDLSGEFNKLINQVKLGK